MDVIVNPDDKTFGKQVDRNLKGIELEKQGMVDEAIPLYEKNVEDLFIGSHPYDRLAIIYHKRNQYQDEARVIKCAIQVFEALLKTPRLDIKPKLEKYKSRLQKLENKK